MTYPGFVPFPFQADFTSVGIDNDLNGGSHMGVAFLSNRVEVGLSKRDTLIALEVKFKDSVVRPNERQGRDPGDWIISIDVIQRQAYLLSPTRQQFPKLGPMHFSTFARSFE
jgi:hypothetical protein